ncbi:MAG: hypothetical protein LQ347_005867, partial [Umbilicaria vellea]
LPGYPQSFPATPKDDAAFQNDSAALQARRQQQWYDNNISSPAWHPREMEVPPRQSRTSTPLPEYRASRGPNPAEPDWRGSQTPQTFSKINDQSTLEAPPLSTRAALVDREGKAANGASPVGKSKRSDTAWRRQKRIVGGAPLQFHIPRFPSTRPADRGAGPGTGLPRGQMLASEGGRAPHHLTQEQEWLSVRLGRAHGMEGGRGRV